MIRQFNNNSSGKMAKRRRRNCVADVTLSKKTKVGRRQRNASAINILF